MNLYQTLLVSFLAIGSVASIGCADTSNAVDNGKPIASVMITPEKATFTKGTTLQFTATLKYGDGTTKDVTRDSTTLWNSSDANIVTISSDGLASALNVGVGTVSASFDGEKGEESFAVTP